MAIGSVALLAKFCVLPKYMENFSTFTELDPDNDLTHTCVRASWTTMDRDAECSLRKNYGAGHFGNFEHWFDVRFSTIEAGDASNRDITNLWRLDNFSTPRDPNNNFLVSATQNGATDNVFKLKLRQQIGGVKVITWNGAFVYLAGTTYYFKITRAGATVRLRVYSDSARTALLEDSGNQVGNAVTYQYLKVSVGFDNVNDPTDWSTGYIENLNLHEGTVDLFAKFFVRAVTPGSEDLFAKFVVGQDSKNLFAKFRLSTIEISLREHKVYAAWNPDWQFSKSAASVLKGNSPTADRLGFAWAFFTVNRKYIHGKYLRIRWRADYTIGTWATQIQIWDGAYDRSSDVDFPSGSQIPNKGNGQLQIYLAHAGDFGWVTEEVQIDVSGGSQDEVTIFIWSGDAWSAQTGYFEVDFVEINSAAAGSGRLFYEPFNAAVVMEQTGTIGDYGYISDGELPSADDQDLFAKATIRRSASEDLFAKFTVKQEATEGLFAKFTVSKFDQDSAELLAKAEIRNIGSAELLGNTEIRQASSVELLARCVIRHDGIPVELLTNAEIRHPAFVELLANVEIRQPGSAELSAKFEIQDSEDLLAKIDIRQSTSVELPARLVVRGIIISNAPFCKFVVRHTTSLALSGKAEIRHPNAAEFIAHIEIRQTGIPVELLGKIDIRQPASVGLLVQTQIRQTASVELLGKIKIRYTGIPIELLSKFDVRQPASAELLGKAQIRHPFSTELLANTEIRHPSFAELLSKFEIQDSEDLFGKIKIRHPATIELLARIKIRHEGPSPPELFCKTRIRHVGISHELLAHAEIRQPASVELLSKFTIGLQSSSAELYARADIRNISSAELLARAEIRHPASAELLGKLKIAQSSSAELLVNAEIRQPASAELLIKFVSGLSDSSAELLGKADIRQASLAELLANADIRHPASAELLGKLEIRNIGSAELLAKADIRQSSSVDLLAKFDVAQSSSAEILAKADIRQTSSTELLAKAEIRNIGSAELLANAEIRQPASTELLANAEIRHPSSAELSAKADIRHPASAELLSKAKIRHIGIPAELRGETRIRHEGVPTELLGKASVRHPASIELLGRARIRHSSSAELLAKIIIRHSTSAELYAKFEIQDSEDLFGKTDIRHSASTEFLGRFEVRHSASVELFCTLGVSHWEDLLAGLWVRHPYRLWTNRRYLNGVVELDEKTLDDALLEGVIEGVMNDIRSRLINEGKFVYDAWTDITQTPKLIRRATTYGAVATLYARDIHNPIRRIVLGIRPVMLRQVRAVMAQERAMDYWEGRMERMITLFLTGVGRDLIIVDTDEEEPVFSLEDIPFTTEDPYKILTR